MNLSQVPIDAALSGREIHVIIQGRRYLNCTGWETRQRLEIATTKPGCALADIMTAALDACSTIIPADLVDTITFRFPPVGFPLDD